MDFTVSTAVLAIALAIYSAVTVYFDVRFCRIPNAVTVPMFFAGWLYQGAFHGWSGIVDGALGFAVGFGALFLMWMIGAAGGGDVKLLGGLSVWLGLAMTTQVLIGSLVFVILGTVFMLIWSMGKKAVGNDAPGPLATGSTSSNTTAANAVAAKKSRRLMAFASPVAFATWTILILNWLHWQKIA